MFPTEKMKQNLAYMHQRAPDGKLAPRDHPLHAPLLKHTAEQKKHILNSGGAGMFAKPQDYCRMYPPA
jgi:hypothetical protein